MNPDQTHHCPVCEARGGGIEQLRADLAECYRLSGAPTEDNMITETPAEMRAALRADLAQLRAERDEARAEIDRLRALVPAPKTSGRPWVLHRGDGWVYTTRSTQDSALREARSHVGGFTWRHWPGWYITNRLTGERIDLGPDGRPVTP